MCEKGGLQEMKLQMTKSFITSTMLLARDLFQDACKELTSQMNNCQSEIVHFEAWTVDDAQSKRKLAKLLIHL